jgi:hypothetical protein
MEVGAQFLPSDGKKRGWAPMIHFCLERLIISDNDSHWELLKISLFSTWDNTKISLSHALDRGVSWKDSLSPALQFPWVPGIL